MGEFNKKSLQVFTCCTLFLRAGRAPSPWGAGRGAGLHVATPPPWRIGRRPSDATHKVGGVGVALPLPAVKRGRSVRPPPAPGEPARPRCPRGPGPFPPYRGRLPAPPRALISPPGGPAALGQGPTPLPGSGTPAESSRPGGRFPASGGARGAEPLPALTRGPSGAVSPSRCGCAGLRARETANLQR